MSLVAPVNLSRLLILFAFALPGCDTGGPTPAGQETGGPVEAVEPEVGPVSIEATSDLSSEEVDELCRGAKRHKKAERRVARLCETVGCDDEQRAALLAARPGPDGERGARREAVTQARRDFAAAFRTEGFAGSDVARFNDARKGAKPDRATARLERHAQVHEILRPEQREKLAQRLESAPRRGGHAGAGGAKKRRGSQDDPTRPPAGAHAAERLCAQLECSGEQIQQIGALFATRHEQAREAIGRRRSSEGQAREAAGGKRAEVARMMRAESFDDSEVRARLEARQSRQDEKSGLREGATTELLVGIHALLTPVQRAKLAELIEAGKARQLLASRRPKSARSGRRGGARRP